MAVIYFAAMTHTYLPTPSLVVDAAIVRRNLQRLADYAAKHGLKIRPHTKTHKSTRLAAMQLEAGATGLTIAKVGEAETMAEVGSDLFMAFPAVDPERCRHLAQLALRTTVRVGLDSATAAEAQSAAAAEVGATVGVLVDLDVGMGRTGVQTPEDALALAQTVEKLPGLRLDGLMIYPGHVRGPAEDQGAALAAVDAKVAATLALWKEHGLSAEIVSGGSTPSAYQSHLLKNVTEIRPGTYVYNDMNTVRGGYVTLDDCAARITATVISTAVPGQFVVDAGSKTLTSDLCGPAPDSGYGYVMEYPEARIVKLSEEHGQCDAKACDKLPVVGERVTIIPNHICPCVNLQDVVWWRDGDQLEQLPVDARGKLF